MARLLEQVSGIGQPVARENHFGAGSFDFGQVRGVVSQKEFMVVFTHDRCRRIVFLQTLLESRCILAAEGVILVEDIKLRFFFPNLAVVIGEGAGNLFRGERRLEGVAGKIAGILEVIRHGGRIDGDDFVLLRGGIDDSHHVAAVGSPQHMNLFLQNHAFEDFFALIDLAHVIGLDDLDELLFSVDEDAAPLVQIVGHPVDDQPVDLAVDGRRSGK